LEEIAQCDETIRN